MLRIALIAGALLISASLLVDPYTHFVDNNSPFIPSPLWRLGLVVLELLLILAFCIFVWRKRYRRAGLVLSGATFVSLLVNAIIVSREGISRFLIAFGTEQILSLYLVLIAVRVAMLGITFAFLSDLVDDELHLPIAN